MAKNLTEVEGGVVLRSVCKVAHTKRPIGALPAAVCSFTDIIG